MTPQDVADLLRRQRVVRALGKLKTMPNPAERTRWARYGIGPDIAQAVKDAWADRKACALCGAEGHAAKDCKWTK
jgi:hypothetical protein